MTPHRWSGWPGAWCLDCGVGDSMEVCLDDHAVWDAAHELFECPDGTHQTGACPETMSRRHDPYAAVES